MITSDWTKWKFFFCDERIVPFDDDECTFSVYKKQLFSKIPLTDENFVIIDPSLSGIIHKFNSKSKVTVADVAFVVRSQGCRRRLRTQAKSSVP
jgi:6-phosphogluconolactonase/glucosamine-6-phosphate isomerase/deaminase